MRRYPFYLVDAFTTTALGGNPCAVVLDADTLDTTHMQDIAQEMNLSETAFVQGSSIAEFKARYFTPTIEVPLAGHPTIATVMALLAAGRLTARGEQLPLHRVIDLELNVGVIRVEIQSAPDGLPTITMVQPAPQFMQRYAPADVLPLFGLEPRDMLAGLPIQTVSTGTPQLMVPLRDHAALRRASPHASDYQAFRAEADFFSPHFFCLEGATARGQTYARHFVPPGTSEDPATGSATGGMAAYLWHYRVIESPRFIAEQGHWMNRPSTMQVEVVGPPDAVSAVRVGGSAVVIVEGSLSLPEA